MFEPIMFYEKVNNCTLNAFKNANIPQICQNITIT